MKFLTALILLWSGICSADSGVQITNLYDINGFLPGFLIPFNVQGGLLNGPNPGLVQSYSVSSDGGISCGLMQDPFITQNYLLKCSSPGKATLHFVILAQGSTYPVDYGPVSIISSTGVQIGGTGGAPSPGETLFQNTCARCHGPGGRAKPLNKPTVDQINTQIATNANMQMLQGLLTQDQITLIAAYLGTL